MRGTANNAALRLVLAIFAVVAIALGGCSSGDAADDSAESGSGSQSDGEAATSAGDEADSGESGDTAAANDEPSAPGVDNVSLLEAGTIVTPDFDGPSAELTVLQDDPYVAAAQYPRPDYEANPWSQWGQGIVLDDGRVITAIGDHLGADGNSYLFVYEPDSGRLTRFADVLSALPHESGSWGYGKIHSQMVDAGTGGVFFTTYYGSRRDISFDGSYEGDVLFRLDNESLDLQPVSVPVPRFGIPSLASDGAGLIFGEAVDPLLDEDTYPEGGFLVFDTATGEAKRFEEDPRHDVFRNVLVTADGSALFAADGGGLFQYDPNNDEVALSDISLPSGLRASTRPTSDGTVFGVTDDPDRFFALEPDGAVRELGEAIRYTTSVALLPDESGFLYVPGAHGRAHLEGAPLIRVDGATGEQTTIVELRDLVMEEFGLLLGGTYSVLVDEERNQAHIGFNAGANEDEPWGEVMYVIVDLP